MGAGDRTQVLVPAQQDDPPSPVSAFHKTVSAPHPHPPLPYDSVVRSFYFGVYHSQTCLSVLFLRICVIAEMKQWLVCLRFINRIILPGYLLGYFSK